MMKNQLAGLMKQAQQMQENLKKAQDELAHGEPSKDQVPVLRVFVATGCQAGLSRSLQQSMTTVLSLAQKTLKAI